MATTESVEVAPAPPITENTYARQDSLNLKIPPSVIVVGCGGVGSWLSLFLALAGAKQLWLWDNDTVSDHNLNRLPLTKDSVGKSKSEALSDLIKSYRPDCDVYAMGLFESEQAAIACGDIHKAWLVCTTDTWASRKMCNAWATIRRLNYLEAAAEGEIGSITGEPAAWATDDEAKPGYASVPVWVGPCVMAASLACAHILHSTKLGEESIRIGWTEGGIVFYNSKSDHPEPPKHIKWTLENVKQAKVKGWTYNYTDGCKCAMCIDIQAGVLYNYDKDGRRCS